MAEKEEESLMLLERVFLRFGSAETDEQLETSLSKFLSPVLLKLSDTTKLVQEKVLDLLTHINKRVKNRPVIQLPVAELLKQLLDPGVSSFVHNFTVIYIKMGYIRLPPTKQIELMPDLISSFKGRPQNQLNILLQLFMNSLIHFKLPSNDQEKQTCFFFQLPSEFTRIVLSSMFDFLFLPYNVTPRTDDTSTPPPGMSEYSFKSLYGEVPMSGDDIEKIKIVIVQIVGLFPIQDVTCHLLVASTDPRHNVAGSAELKIKQLIRSEEWNNSNIVKKLYEIFLGTTQAERNVKPVDKRRPCCMLLRIKIMNILVKCNEAPKYFPASIQVVYESLFSTNTNSKLKLSTLQFVHHLCHSSSQQEFDLMSPMLNEAVLKLVQNNNEDNKVKGQAYLAIGKIGKRNPTIVTKKISSVQHLFDALSQSEEEIIPSIQDCLVMLCPAFKHLEPAKMNQLEALIMHHIEGGNDSSRLVSVRYASSIFPSNHLPTRYALLLACSDVKEEISSEATRALNEDNNSNVNFLPSFVDFMQFIDSKVSLRKIYFKKGVQGRKILPFKKITYTELLKYTRRCLNDNAMRFNSIRDEDQLTLTHIVKYILSSTTLSPDDDGGGGGGGGDDPLQLFINLMVLFLSVHKDASVWHCLLEMVCIMKGHITYNFLGEEAWIKDAMFSTGEEVSRYAAELYAVLVTSSKSESELCSVIDNLVGNLSDKTLEKQQGSLVSYGFIMSQLGMRMKQDKNFMKMHDGSRLLLDTVLKFIVNKLREGKQMFISLAACASLTEIARCGWCANIPDDDDDDRVSKLMLTKVLVEKVQSSKENLKVREKAALCLGMLCVGDGNFKHKQLVIDGLLQSAAAKQYELHWVIGEALVLVGQGSRSSEGRDKWLETEENAKPEPGDPNTDVTTILDLILNKYIRNPNPHLRQAGCIWLLTLVKKVGDWPEIQSQIMRIQTAFISLLDENDDLTQGVVSSGLAVVYEKGSEGVKKELVSCLVDSLTSGKKRKLEVSPDTAVFDEGFLGTTPEGQNISTYKDLCTIANDLNQTDLIYKFMNLANHNAALNLKKGAAHGFNSIASQASEQLTPYLDKIVPKLYRYQFDPNPRIKSAMQEIWNSLVSDQDKMISKFMKEILEDLNQNMTHPQWRVRESSCYALGELLRGRFIENDVVGILPDLWQTLFRVRDDIKESVRKAADFSLQSLSKVTIKMCDRDGGFSSTAEKTISLMLPVLLNCGVLSTVEEVKSISLTTLMKLSKSAGILVKPHVANLVVALLDSISTFEPQLLNYLSQHAANNQTALDLIEKARISSCKSSPMMEVIDHCIQMTDASVLELIIPKMIDLLRTSVSVGTKVCTSTVIISLVQRCPNDLAPYTGKLLAVLVNGSNDQNSSIRKSYASAIGYVAKISKDSSVEKLINKLQECYFEKDDERARETCASTIHSMNLVSPDLIKRHSSSLLPLVFFAMHAPQNTDATTSPSVNSNFEETWQEGVPGTEAGVKLYALEIVELIKRSFESPSWMIRGTGGRAMLTLIEKITTNLPTKQFHILLSSLLSALPGRTWSGKETLLKALSTLCTTCKETIMSDGNEIKIDDVIDVVMKECKKGNVKYKVEAIGCMTNIIDTFKIDKFNEVWSILAPFMGKKEELKKGDDDDDEMVDSALKRELLQISFKALSCCWPANFESQELHQEVVCEVYITNVGTNGWQVEVSLLRSLKIFLQRWFVLTEENKFVSNELLVSKLLTHLMPAFCQFLGNSSNSILRSETLSVTECLLEKMEECNKISMIKMASYKEELVIKLTDISANDSQEELRTRAQALLQNIS